MGKIAGSRSIVLVEDEPSVQKLIHDVLKSAGYNPIPFANAEQVIPWIDSNPEKVDLLITDIKMPGMSGKELADRLCRSHPKLMVLFISGYSEYDQKDLNSCANPDGHFLEKPFLPSELVRRVNAIFAKGEFHG
jgi:two-component system cell cycle sensor histidine kinase/response regulator CckA